MFIQVVHDLVCPWCRIGKDHLDRAIEAWTANGGEDIVVQWFPFQLDPLPAGANEGFRQRMIERKGFSEGQLDSMFLKLSRVAAADGIEFRFDRVELAQNTLLAHQAIALVTIAQQSALIDALHDAYFLEGKNLESIDVLIDAASCIGVTDLETLQNDLDAGARSSDVDEQIAQACRAGISGVPFFIIDGKVGLSGAQPVETILDAIEQAALVTPVR